MSYVEKNLMSGEVVVYQARLHWAIYLPAIVWGALSVLICFAGIEAVVVAVILILALVMPLAASALINRKTAEFAITNKRILMKFGFIRRTSLEVLLSKVEGITVHQGILGRILDYGTIVVGGIGGSKTPFPKIADPLKFRREVQEQIEKNSP